MSDRRINFNSITDRLGTGRRSDRVGPSIHGIYRQRDGIASGAAKESTEISRINSISFSDIRIYQVKIMVISLVYRIIEFMKNLHIPALPLSSKSRTNVLLLADES